MKEIVILVLSVSLVSMFAGTANAMHLFWSSSSSDDDDSQETVVDTQDEGCSLMPIVSDQPPEDEEHWPGCRD